MPLKSLKKKRGAMASGDFCPVPKVPQVPSPPSPKHHLAMSLYLQLRTSKASTLAGYVEDLGLV
jgi:hypothetical protein